MLNEPAVKQALRRVTDVGGSGDIVSNNRVQKINITEGVVKISLALPTTDRDERERIEDACFDTVMALEGVKDVGVVVQSPKSDTGAKAGQRPPGPPSSENPFDGQAPIAGIRHIIAIASGKGGVGKSTVAVNLALALHKRGARVGLLDADVYGPSLPILLGAHDKPRAGKTKEISPLEKDGIKLMSLGFLTQPGMPVIWRGPIVMGVIKKLLLGVEWGELDYLLVDLPPGTGDVQLTLVQTVPITGAIIVTTPSELALVDAERGLRMFEEVNVPVFGIVENMSTFVCPHCGEKTDIFDTGGGEKIGKRTRTDVLGHIPLDPRVRAGGDDGNPIVKLDAESPISQAFFAVADKILEHYPMDSVH
ncbi:MAG: Mrp/NBP35 family ATP-binding protein [Candidatus Krumholzibacteria bacterium]